MKVKNNYDECLTNLACSVRKYFELPYKHKTLKYIDELLESKEPENVVVLLFDGLGSKILDRTLEPDDFFRRNKLKDITTVFPATTTAATTSVRTGTNPIEHGWLGWDMYIEPIDKTITLFLNREKGKKSVCEDFLGVRNMLITKTITDEINECGKYTGTEIMPIGKNSYSGLDDMLGKIECELKKPGKKYIYAYDDEPDKTMHVKRSDSPEAARLIKERNKKLEEFCSRIENTVFIVVADHGHINVKNYLLTDYPEILDMLERTTSIEPRAVSFKVKDGLSEKFEKKFDELFGRDFTLYTKGEVEKSRLFGDGEPNPLFSAALGDYIAIAESSDKCIIASPSSAYLSHHAGYTDDEIYVPLIVIDRV